MCKEYLKKWFNASKEVVLAPAQFFTKQTKKKSSFGDSFQFVLATLAIFGIIEMIVFDWIVGQTFLAGIALFFVRIVIRVTFFQLLTGLYALCMHLIGSVKKYKDTYHAIAHAYPAFILVALIANVIIGSVTSINAQLIISSVALAYIAYIQTIAISKAHKTTASKAIVGTIILPLVLLIVLTFLAAIGSGQIPMPL